MMKLSAAAIALLTGIAVAAPAFAQGLGDKETPMQRQEKIKEQERKEIEKDYDKTMKRLKSHGNVQAPNDPWASVRPAAAEAKTASAGIWKGCFVAPQDFRAGKKDGTLLGAACRPDRDKEIRAVLFPEEPTMPPSCSVKGKLAVRARVTGNIGIYHLRGCPSYPATTKPDRWFCSEDDAQAAGFRKAYNCRRPK